MHTGGGCCPLDTCGACRDTRGHADAMERRSELLADEAPQREDVRRDQRRRKGCLHRRLHNAGKEQWAKYFADGRYRALNLGTSGDRTEHVLWRLTEGHELDGYEAKAILLMIGTNNTGHFPFEKEPPVDTILGVAEILKVIAEKQPTARTILTSVFPRGKDAADPCRLRNNVVNKELAKFADGRKVIWCDFSDKFLDAGGRLSRDLFPDLLHPNALGYEIWASAVLPLIDRVLAADKDEPIPSVWPSNPQVYGYGAHAASQPTGGFPSVGWWGAGRPLEKRNEIVGGSGEYDIVMVGDSITHRWELEGIGGRALFDELKKTYSILNLGYGGDRTEHVIWRMENGELEGYKAKLFTLMVGTNNGGKDVEGVSAGVKRIIETIKAKHPESKIVLMPIFPRGASDDHPKRLGNEKVNAVIKDYADGETVIWLDFNKNFFDANGKLTKEIMGDFLHPTEKGYRIWLDAILPVFKKVVGVDRACGAAPACEPPSLLRGPAQTPLRVGMKRIGAIAPRPANAAPASQWMIGCETLDRDFADFESYKMYLKPLGIGTMRIQGGWAKCERTKGRYDFSWLDRVVDYARSRGMAVLLEAGYGNPLYEGGGGSGLGGGFPVSEEAVAAWDAWVDALTRHFSGRVRDWAIWNEPDIRPRDGSRPKTPQEIAAFNIRTARIVKRNIPDARIAGLSLASNQPEALEKCLQAMGRDIDLFDWFIYHGYAPAPESSYANVEALKRVLAKYSSKARMRQGENGCPSEMNTTYALNHIPWSEYSQAKWDMRRMLGDLGHDVESGLFTFCDYNNPKRELNHKGLLRATENKEVVAVKRAYYAVQNLVSVFDDSLTRVKEPAFTTLDATLSTYEYRKADGRPVFVFWSHAAEMTHSEPVPGSNTPPVFTPVYLRPGDSFETRPAAFSFRGPALKEPVWVDLFTGSIYALPESSQCVHSAGVVFVDVPVYDSPCLITERSVVDVSCVPNPANPR